MKILKFLFIALVAVCFASCNSEDNNYDIEYTNTYPLDGQYKVTITDEQDSGAIATQYCYIANTSDNVNNKIWIRIGNYSTSASNAYSINAKMNCDVSALTFSGSNENLAGNVASSDETVTITDGSVVLKGVTAPSGTVCDKVSFTFTRTNFPGKTYTVTGYRYTGWSED